jgi:hypothetical protein
MHNMIIGIEVPIRVNGIMKATEMGTEDGQKMMDVGEGGVMSKGVVVAADGGTKVVVMNGMTRAAGGRRKTMKAGVMMMITLLLNRTEHLPKAVG